MAQILGEMPRPCVLIINPQENSEASIGQSRGSNLRVAPRASRLGVHVAWYFEMDRRGHGTVTRSTVYRTLVRNSLIEPKSRRRSHQDYRRWERSAPMQLWQLNVRTRMNPATSW
jgi:hypothetical protein